MSAVLAPELLKARLAVVRAFTGGPLGIEIATSAWMALEPDAESAMAVRLFEAVGQVVGDKRLLALALYASSAFRLEISEAIDGSR